MVQYTCLPFGVSLAPAMENLLQEFKHVVAYTDDILITGSTVEEYLSNLTGVLHKLREAGICLKRRKCLSMAPKVEYLGHLRRDCSQLKRK